MNGDTDPLLMEPAGPLQNGELILQGDALNIYAYEVRENFILNQQIHETPIGQRTLLLVGVSKPGDQIVALFLSREPLHRRPASGVDARGLEGEPRLGKKIQLEVRVLPSDALEDPTALEAHLKAHALLRRVVGT